MAGETSKPKIIVQWSKLQAWEDRLNHTNKTDVGVYCAVGKDNYDNQRIYIGKATGTDTFSSRMSKHSSDGKEKKDEFLQKITQNRQIMYGTISSSDIDLSDKNVLNSYIEDLEVFLIRKFDKDSSKYQLANDIKYEDYKYKNGGFIINYKDPNKIFN